MLELLLNDLPIITFILLVVCAGGTSVVTAAFGIGGGVLLLGVMAQVISPLLIIPLHGVVQLGSNGSRALMSWRHIDWRLISAFLPGALLGAFVGQFVLVAIPAAVMYLSIAAFILYLCWGPKLSSMAFSRWGISLAGALSTFITLFVGATGPLVAAFVKQINADRFRTVATFAMAMSVQHLCKIAVFHGAGVNLLPWIPLLLCMVISGTIGTWFGLKLLKKVPDKLFSKIFNGLLTLLALRLIWQASIELGVF